jgi:hypothetical protein
MHFVEDSKCHVLADNTSSMHGATDCHGASAAPRGPLRQPALLPSVPIAADHRITGLHAMEAPGATLAAGPALELLAVSYRQWHSANRRCSSL